MANVSYWISSTADAGADRPELPEQADVVVLGAGIAGITTAYLLKQLGLRVALIEAGELAAGVTGHTTAKVTVQHGPVHQRLRRSFNAETATAHARAQTAALEWLAATSARLGIDCELTRSANVLYTEQPGSVPTLRAEAEAAAAAGLPAAFADHTDLPFPVAGAVRLADQAKFHPRKWLLGLAALIPGDGCSVHTGVRALALTEGDPCVVTTTEGRIRAEHVVVATHYPIFDRGAFFPRLQPRRDLVVAGPGQGPPGMYLDVDTAHSVRTAPLPGGEELLIVGGEGHLVDEGDNTGARFERLAEWARERLGLTEIRYRWMAHDLSTPDGLPYIGRFHPFTKKVWVATGFGHWGMTNGTLAGLILRDLISGVASPHAALFDPLRTTLAQSAPKFVKTNAHVAARLVGDRFAAATAGGVDQLAEGQAVVTTVGTKAVAAYRKPGGELCALGARCTHLGCLVAFNDGEQTWDCPCHGSRFALDGSVIQGPAVRPLPKVDLGDG
ncbi:FAD-dependent oxidoreductase [Crossiella sp. NPDC003009]